MRNEDEKLREAARMLSANCDRHSTGCKGCLFCRDELYCKINGIPIAWDNDFGFGDHFREVTKKVDDHSAEVRNMVDDHSVDVNKKVDDHSANTGKKFGDRISEISKAIGTMVGTPTAPVAPTDTPTDTPTTRAEILDAAKKIVTGDREKQYGSPEDNFAVIARFWEVYLNQRCVDAMSGFVLNPDDVAILMALLKVARIMTGTFKGDSYIDACGYLACAAEIAGR